jgi:AraC-like DNA-binding protein
MKVIQFTVPVDKSDSVVIQEDILPNFYHYLHRHKEVQISLILKGEGTLIAGNFTQPFKAGDIYILGANQPHLLKGDAKYLKLPNKNNIHAIHIFFDAQQLLTPLNAMPEFVAIHQFLKLTDSSLQLPSNHYQKTAKEIIKISKASGFNRLISFLQLLDYFSKEVKDWRSLSTGFSKKSFSESEGMRMNDIYQYTLENYAEDITLKKIAAVVHLSTYAFCKYFKKHTRKTYLNFLNEIRINEACRRILHGDSESISAIAYAIGFNSTITFNRVFKKVTGMSPTNYVKVYKFKD